MSGFYIQKLVKQPKSTFTVSSMIFPTPNEKATPTKFSHNIQSCFMVLQALQSILLAIEHLSMLVNYTPLGPVYSGWSVTTFYSLK